GRTPATDPEPVRAALAQVAELAALLLHDDAIRAEPVPDLGPALELLAVAGSALEGVQLAALTRALAGARLTAAELARLARDAPRRRRSSARCCGCCASSRTCCARTAPRSRPHGRCASRSMTCARGRAMSWR